tara:strand:+ start:46 stop:147 length:102 start_codon:yes stop_codon:yes gene_type:complete
MEKEVDWDRWPVTEVVLVVLVFVLVMGLLWLVG